MTTFEKCVIAFLCGIIVLLYILIFEAAVIYQELSDAIKLVRP